MNKTIWLNLDPEKVYVTHLEKRFSQMVCKFIAQAAENNDREKVLSLAGQADVVIATMEPWDEEALRAVKGKVKFIQKYGAGLDTIDTETAGRYGIPVANVPGANSAAVAEVAMLHMMNVGRRFASCAAGVKAGVWPSTTTGTELDGKTVGIMGYGFIAKQVIRMLSGFRVKILVYDAFVNQAEPGHVITFVDSPEELFEQSDLVSLHIPLNEQTKGCMNRSLFQRMKKGSYLINTCRGGVINEEDLIEALESGRLGGAGLDVMASEPPQKDNPLMKMDQVFITSHMGAASLESEHRSQVIMADAIETFLNGRLPDNVKNRSFLPGNER